MKVKDKNILVFGLARSGVGAANLLSALGADVTATDKKTEGELSRYIKLLCISRAKGACWLRYKYFINCFALRCIGRDNMSRGQVPVIHINRIMVFADLVSKNDLILIQ